MKQNYIEFEDEVPLSCEDLNRIVERKYDEYLKANEEYHKSLNSKFEYLNDKYLRYAQYGVEGYLHVRKVFLSKDDDNNWYLFLQGLGFRCSISDYQDDCDFHWNWWTEVKLPKRIYDDEEMLKVSLVIIDEREFRKVFKDYINEMNEKMEQILDEKLDSPDN